MVLICSEKLVFSLPPPRTQILPSDSSPTTGFMREEKQKRLLTSCGRRQEAWTAIDVAPRSNPWAKLFAPEAADILRDATVDENTDVRHAAFQQLSRIDSTETVQVLRERLTHPDATVRLMAIEAMAARGEVSAREAAMVTLDDSDEAVQSKATGLLQELEAQEGGGI